MPGTGNTTDPWLHELGPQRTTLVRYQDGTSHTYEDNRDQSREQLPGLWKGESKFMIIKQTSTRDDTTAMQLDTSV